MSPRAVSPAQSSPPCSCAVSWKTPKHGFTSTSLPGHPRPSRPDRKAPNAKPHGRFMPCWQSATASSTALASRRSPENNTDPKRSSARAGMPVEMRASQALKLLHEFTYALVKDKEPDLSARQLAILLTIYLEPPPHTVRGVAAKLGVTKPV